MIFKHCVQKYVVFEYVVTLCIFRDLSWNVIRSFGKTPKPFIDLVMLYDHILDHNDLTNIKMSSRVS